MMTKDDIELLFRTYYRKMLIRANRLMHDEEVARDIVHDVFASLLSGKVESATESYLLRGVALACLKHIRDLSIKERIRKLYALEYDDVESGDWPDEEDVELIRKTVDSELPEMTRLIVRHRFYHGMRYKEIAHLLSVSEVTVYKHLHHAIGVLRQKLKNHEG